MASAKNTTMKCGVNSRLDSLQAAILKVKLPHLDEYCAAKESVAEYYDHELGNIPGVKTPARATNSTHVYHQYTLQIPARKGNH